MNLKDLLFVYIFEVMILTPAQSNSLTIDTQHEYNYATKVVVGNRAVTLWKALWIGNSPT